MMKFLRILKIIVLVFVVGAGIYLFFVKSEKQSSEIDDAISQDEKQNEEKTSLLGEDGTYNLEDEKLIVSVTLPDEENKYIKNIYAYGEEQIQRFVSDKEEFKNISSESFPWNLDIDYKKSESDTIVSYLVQGYEYTGGAHGNAFLKSFNFDKKTGKELGVEDIVTSKETFKTLSALAKKELTVDYPEGADERPENWSVWYVDDTSITFVFMAYQIAAYATGQQELKIEMTEKNRALFQEKYFGQ